jgi:hypothetical protein
VLRNCDGRNRARRDTLNGVGRATLEIRKMKILGKVAFAVILGASSLALTATNASARIVCNDDGDCWHVKTEYEYPPSVRLEVHPDDWRWKEGEKHAWREHEGRGYWHSGAWVGF